MSPLKGLMRTRVVDLLRAGISHLRERAYGMRTETSVSLEELGLAHPERLLYVPSSWKSVRTLANILKPTPDDTFVDFGSGKGRVVVLLARRLALRRVVGVEISPELHAVASQNLEASKSRLKTRVVDLVNADVTAFNIPNDMTIAYIYSSFTGEIFRDMIRSVERNLPNFTGGRLVVALQLPTNGSARDAVLATNDAFLRKQDWLLPLDRVKLRSITGWRSEIAFYSAFGSAGPAS